MIKFTFWRLHISLFSDWGKENMLFTVFSFSINLIRGSIVFMSAIAGLGILIEEIQPFSDEQAQEQADLAAIAKLKK